MHPHEYSGKELQFFKNATNWKRYFSKKLLPYIKGNVLEVGAGMGGTTAYLLNENVKDWTCIEPDHKLYNLLKTKNSGNIIRGTVQDLPASACFDTIIYIDVLEHIENDSAEIEMASRHLNTNGILIVLSPAWNFLMSEFDREIGHYRRYNRQSLANAVKSNKIQPVKIFFLESAGILLLLINKFILRLKYPTEKNISFWDKYFIPVSRLTDKLLNYSTGKTIIGIWKKQ